MHSAGQIYTGHPRITKILIANFPSQSKHTNPNQFGIRNIRISALSKIFKILMPVHDFKVNLVQNKQKKNNMEGVNNRYID